MVNPTKSLSYVVLNTQTLYLNMASYYNNKGGYLPEHWAIHKIFSDFIRETIVNTVEYAE